MDYCININLIHLDIPALILADKTCRRRSANLALVARGYPFSNKILDATETHYTWIQRLTENTSRVPIQRQCHYLSTPASIFRGRSQAKVVPHICVRC